VALGFLIYIALHNSNYKGLKRQVKGLAQIFIAPHHNCLLSLTLTAKAPVVSIKKSGQIKPLPVPRRAVAIPSNYLFISDYF
jgi:hypothetical protein